MRWLRLSYIPLTFLGQPRRDLVRDRQPKPHRSPSPGEYDANILQDDSCSATMHPWPLSLWFRLLRQLCASTSLPHFSQLGASRIPNAESNNTTIWRALGVLSFHLQRCTAENQRTHCTLGLNLALQSPAKRDKAISIDAVMGEL